MPADHWDWSIPVSFSQGWRVDDLVFVGGQISFAPDGKVIGPGDIEAQTRKTFDYIRRVLHEGGADDPDLVKLNTWYGFEGEGAELKEYRERMARVELEYLAGPGPVDTAVRIAGLATGAILVEIDAIAACGGEKISADAPGAPGPEHARAPVPVFVRRLARRGPGVRGRAGFHGRTGGGHRPGRRRHQTRNAYDRVGRVLEAAGAGFEDLVQVNIFYRYDGPRGGNRSVYRPDPRSERRVPEGAVIRPAVRFASTDSPTRDCWWRSKRLPPWVERIGPSSPPMRGGGPARGPSRRAWSRGA